MAKLEVTKTIEARKLNKRTRQPVAEPPVTIPYAAILSEIVDNDGIMNFMYMGELYQCRSEVLRSSSHSLEGSLMPAPSSGGAAPSETLPVTFVWEKLRTGSETTSRARLPGGWLIAIGEGAARSVVFYPDPAHDWDGTTL